MAPSTLYLIDDVDAIERGELDRWVRDAGGAPSDLVVLPAFVEHRPRRILQAVAAGLPVIASTECGLGGVDGVETVESGDAIALRDAVVRSLATCHAKTSAASSN